MNGSSQQQYMCQYDLPVCLSDDVYSSFGVTNHCEGSTSSSVGGKAQVSALRDTRTRATSISYKVGPIRLNINDANLHMN